MIWFKGKGILWGIIIVTSTWLFSCGGSSVREGSAQEECRVVKHKMGESCVPLDPQRVIVLDTSPLDAALALGVTPIAAPELPDFLSYSPAQLEGVQSIGTYEQPNLERMLELQPDLILATPYDAAEIYPQLQQLAPTVVAPSGDVEWKADLAIYAEALGKTAEADRLLQNYQERIEEFQLRMGDRLPETEVSIVSAGDYGPGLPVRIYLAESFMGSVLEEAGLSRPEGQRQRKWTIEISLEQLQILESDAIFLMEYDPEQGILDRIRRHPLWSRLQVVEAGHVYPVNYGSWVGERNIGGANRILDDLFEHLLE